MKKYIISSLVAIALVFSVVTPARAATVAELQAMIAQLTAQIAAMGGQSGTFDETNTSATLTTNLTVGSRGAEVTILQNFLVSKGFLTIPNNLAKGYFGSLTKAAVIQYQVASGLSENAGYVGPITRAKINAMLNSGGDSGTTGDLVITSVAGMAAGNFEIDLNSTAYVGIKGIGTDRGAIRVYIGGILSSVTQASGDYIYVNTPSDGLAVGSTYELYVVKGKQRSNTVKVRILSKVTVTQPVIRVLSPNGGEILKEGDQYTIRWESKNIPTDAKIIIDIFNGGTNISVPNSQIAVLPYNATSYSWKVQGNTGGWGLGSNSFTQKLAKAVGIKVANAASDKYMIGVRAFNSGGQVTYDNTNDYFTITTGETGPQKDGESANGLWLKSVTLQDVKNDEVGIWDVFGPGKGNANKNALDWYWQLKIDSEKATKIKSIKIEHTPAGEGWSTAMTYMYNRAYAYPLKVVAKGYENTKYESNINVVVNKGDNYYDLYGQPESTSFRGAKITVEFADGTVLYKDIPSSSIKAPYGETNSPTATESYIDAESSLTPTSAITLRPGASETVYGLKYKVTGNAVVIERVDFDLVNQKNNRSAGDYIDSIQLLNMNKVAFATLRGSDGDSDDRTTGYRFAGLNYRLENGGGIYVRLNLKTTLPEKAEFDISIPKDGMRYLDGSVSDTFGNASVVREISFEPSGTVNVSAGIPFNSPDYQRMEISLPNGTKQVIFEKTGTTPGPRILSLSKTSVAAGEIITIETQNVGVTADTTIYFDTFKGNRYEAKAKATNTANGGQKLTVPVSPSLANGQYYVYLSNENGISNYKGLIIQSGQGANVYSSIQELLNKISLELANQ